MADSITVIGMRAAKQKRRGKKGKKGKGIKKLTPEEMKFKLKENDKSIRGMQKQLFEIEVQAHTNRKEVDGVRASVKRILKAHDLAMNTQGENVNVRIVAARVQDQVTAVSNVLRSHETVLSQVYSTLEEFTNDMKQEEMDENKDADDILKECKYCYASNNIMELC